jgi:hypothetical protein
MTMIGHLTGHMGHGPENSHNAWKNLAASGRSRAEILLTIDGLYVISRRSLWRLLLFLVISAAALWFRNVDLFAVFPASIREILGAPPPAGLIHIVLAVSTGSALILIAGRNTGDAKEGPGWLQFGMSAVFYPIYAVSNALNEIFPVVFAAGLVILVLEYFTNWSQAAQLIRAEKESLGKMS